MRLITSSRMLPNDRPVDGPGARDSLHVGTLEPGVRDKADEPDKNPAVQLVASAFLLARTGGVPLCSR
jgi:hypothetical protein